MHRSGPAEGDEREVARLDPLLDGQRPDRLRHLGVDDVAHAFGQLDRREAELVAETCERALRGVEVERHLAAREVGRVDAAEREVRVRDGDPRAASAVAGGARVGSGALRPDAQAPRLRVRDRAATGSDRVDVRRSTSAAGSPRASSRRTRPACRSTTRLTSKLVPPMSTQIRLGRSSMRASATPPIVPPTGPESRVCSERSRADWAVTIPPEDCMTCNGTARPWRVSSLSSRRGSGAPPAPCRRRRRPTTCARTHATRWPPGGRARSRRRRAPPAGSPRRAARAPG